ncbi:MAG: hypothetical protein KKF46_03450 [Nanoarchaeota archaeon]|nr:hypothetical protein [Nanoarchaeota archaeon]MBU1321390.1 hypothetical protein [Nanoarchaeota archaeon]MBU1597450.1 hypothetical protein [Nanoarchaeota archaeon]MBU2441357.1 hypothetical protein [Nanoarchaeota archaeon]
MKYIILIASILLLFTACTFVDSTSVRAINNNASRFVDQDIIIIDTVSQEMGGSMFNYYITDFEGNRLKIDCPGQRFAHNAKYQISGKIIHNNQTGEYYLLCSGIPKRR